MRQSEEVIKQFNSLLKNPDITNEEKVAAIKKFSYEELSNVPVYLLKDLRDKLKNGTPSDDQITNGLIGLFVTRLDFAIIMQNKAMLQSRSKNLLDKKFPLAIEWKPKLSLPTINKKRNAVPNFQKHIERVRGARSGSNTIVTVSHIDIGKGE